MRPVPVLVILAALIPSTPANSSADSFYTTMPEAVPLSVRVRNSDTIFILEVASVRSSRVYFKTTATLKGKREDVPFSSLRPMSNAENLFHRGDMVLCFLERLAGPDGKVAVSLFVSGQWAFAYPPTEDDGQFSWSCCFAVSEHRFTYEGTTEDLRKHVTALVAELETTITVRAPQNWITAGEPRRWRIKAKPNQTRWILSEDSPDFVGWEPEAADPVQKIVRELHAQRPRERRTPGALYPVMFERDTGFGLIPTNTLARLRGPNDLVATLAGQLRDSNPQQRLIAAEALKHLGPAGRSAIPDLTKSLRDSDIHVQSAAVEGLSAVATDARDQQVVARAFASVVTTEREGWVRAEAMRSLRRFGPNAWTVMQAFSQESQIRDNRSDEVRFQRDTIGLLCRFDPPPVELLVVLAENTQGTPEVRAVAIEGLTDLKQSARTALPVLYRLIQQPADRSRRAEESDCGIRLRAIEAVLAIDPENAPRLVTPILVEMLKQDSVPFRSDIRLLAKCGATAKPYLPAIFASFEAVSREALWAAQMLTPLLGPEHKTLLPTLRRFELLKRFDELGWGEVLCSGSAKATRELRGRGRLLFGGRLRYLSSPGGSLVSPQGTGRSLRGIGPATSHGAGKKIRSGSAIPLSPANHRRRQGDNDAGSRP